MKKKKILLISISILIFIFLLYFYIVPIIKKIEWDNSLTGKITNMEEKTIYKNKGLSTKAMNNEEIKKRAD